MRLNFGIWIFKHSMVICNFFLLSFTLFLFLFLSVTDFTNGPLKNVFFKLIFCRSISKILPLKLFLGYIFWGPKWMTFWQKYFFLGWGTHQIVGIQKAKAYCWYLGHSVDPTIDQKNCYENSQETLKNSLKQQLILETLPPLFEAKFWHIWYVLSIWYFDQKSILSFKWLNQIYQLQIISHFEK